jgi:EpsI family protein
VTVRALILAALFGSTALVLAEASRAEPTPIRKPLAELPIVIGEWQGHVERDFQPEIVKVLGVDDYANRSYVGADGRRLGLYVGYHSNQRQGDTIHSPLNCLPGAGWIPTAQGRTTVDVLASSDGPQRRAIEVNRVIIEKGLDRQVVLYWYQSHGRVVASEYWGKIYTVVDAIRLNRTDAALVRVMAPVPSREPGVLETSESAAVAFVKALFPHLGGYLPS